MEFKEKFKVVFSQEASDFLESITVAAKEKILYNIVKSKFVIDPKLFKKLGNTDIWEFRTKFGGIQYRMLAFWDNEGETLVIATHGFKKKTRKTPANEIERAKMIREIYFTQKQSK